MTGTSTLTAAEVDELRRAAAVGPIDPADVRRILESHEAVLAEPAWGELRSVLNELTPLLED